ncbi:MAG: chemotaxis protein CheA [Bacteroidales bacterium]|nr:chemotaxis protein CheA [Bacteroidales bacterium]
MNESDAQFALEMQELREKFAIEAIEKIADLETAILVLENNPNDKEKINSLFGAMHSLKGSGGMFGYNKISEFTHDLETIYDYVRKDRIKINTELLDISLEAIDHLKFLLRMGDTLDTQSETKHQSKTAKVKEWAGKKLADAQIEHPIAEPVHKSEEPNTNQLSTSTYFISFKPHENIFDNGTKALYLIDELFALGEAFAIPHFENIPALEKINPQLCYTWWEIFLATDESQGTIADVFIFVEDESKIYIHKIADDNLLEYDAFAHYLKQLREANELADLKDLKKIIDALPVKEIPAIPEIAATVKIEHDLTEDEIIITPTTEPTVSGNIQAEAGKMKLPATAAETTIASIRVSSEKIDILMNLVSEMVTIQARLWMYAEKKNDLELIAISENVQKLSKQLRDNAFSISLIPISSILTRFQRLVRDLSATLGKKVKFVIEGQGTELDKTIIERITDPLLHIIRNSLDHGIESPELRKQIGKPEEGTILFRAYYSGSNIHIEVKDDGAGIDKNRILKKAIQNKLINEDDKLSEAQILNLIFAPGFSTAVQVSDVSGRGVGMDVVNKKISEIRGEVVIRSELGKGTSITIILPLTLSIIDGMQVMIGKTCYIIPTSAVHKIYSIKHIQIQKAFDNVIVIDGRQIPYIYLREQFNDHQAIPEKQEVLVVKYENREVGLIIDKVIGEFQTVLKPLGQHYKNQEFVSGGTILGDGSVALVLDTNKIISRFSKENKSKEENI